MQTIQKKGLTVKDLVTIGIFSALFLVFALVGGIFFAPNPVLTFYMPVGSASEPSLIETGSFGPRISVTGTLLR